MSTDFRLAIEYNKKFGNFSMPSVMANMENLSEREVIRKVFVKDISKLAIFFHTDYDTIIDIMLKRIGKTISVDDLFGYEPIQHGKAPYNRNYVKVAENALVRNELVKDNKTIWGKEYQDVYYDVYLSEAKYYECAMNKYILDILRYKFPSLFDLENKCMFYEPTYKFDEDTRQFLKNADENMPVDMFVSELLLCDCKPTIGDIAEILQDRTKIDSMTYKSRIKIYYNYINVFYIELYNDVYTAYDREVSYLRNLEIPLEFLFTKNWETVENYKVKNYPIIKNDKPTSVDGLQKDMPYFNHPMVKEIKNILLNC